MPPNSNKSCIMLDNDGVVTIACLLSSGDCAVCGETLTLVPCMLIYRPSLNIFDPVCRDCGIVIMRSARVRLSDPEYNG